MGAGPYYSFYRPYHLASIEAPLSIPPAVLDGASDIHPRAWRAEVAAGDQAAAAGRRRHRRHRRRVRLRHDRQRRDRREDERLVPLGLLAGPA